MSQARAPVLAVGAIIAANLASLRATLHPIAYADDSSIHEQMVRYAGKAFENGRDPLTGWFPYLGLGSPQFLHYQSLGAMLTGSVGVVLGSDTAFRWSLFLLVGAWPAVIYASARLMRLAPWVAVAAAAASPLLVSVPGVGYEHGAYLWIGYGLWAQLWGSWTLPLAWACSWRACEDRRFIAAAVVSVSLTVALHYETGYLALLAPIIFPWLVVADLPGRLLRSAAVFVLSLSASAWVIGPLDIFSKWAAYNQALQGTSLENGYGAKRVLGWLVTGGVLDHGRLPVVTLAAAAGALVCAARWRREPLGRAIVGIGVVSLLLCFGRTTFGSLVDIVPGSHDVFFRRFMMGVQLASIYLAGIGAVAIVRWAGRALMALEGSDPAHRDSANLKWAAATVGASALVILAVPAVNQISRYDGRDAAAIGTQRSEQSGQAKELQPIVSLIRNQGDGRTYAGMPSNWGVDFKVGEVPVFKYLESQDVDEVGYTLRTASLMTIPEYYFDPNIAGDYELFGIRYLVLPGGMAPPAGADLLGASGPYRLWVLSSNTYVDIVDTVGTISANRVDVGPRTVSLLRSPILSRREDLTVAWAGAPAAPPTVAAPTQETGSPGSVVSESSDLFDGRLDATVRLSRRAVVVLSASYDPGWHVTVDGQPTRAEVIAPAVVGVVVAPGTHRIVFRYVGYDRYPELFALSGLGVAAAAALSFGRRRQQPA